MSARRWGLVFVALALLIAFLPSARAGNEEMRPIVLFNGSDTDSTEQASAWIPVRGARRIVIRTYSTHLAFASNADTTYTDSITTFRLVFSDSLSAVNTNTIICADSALVDAAIPANDTTQVGVIAFPLPINKQLRAPTNGTGLVTYIAPTQPFGAAVTPDGSGVIGKEYMRVRVTPLRRMTIAGFSSTQGIRTVGLRGLKMIAYIYKTNK